MTRFGNLLLVIYTLLVIYYELIWAIWFIPRNCSAPHFLVVDSSNFPRNLSTPGFGRMARLSAQFSSTSGSQDGQVAFGHVAGGQRHSGAGSGLILQPGSRRDSTKNNRPIVRPMYRKDVFYTGSSKHLAISTANTTEMQNGGAPHLTTRPSQVIWPLEKKRPRRASINLEFLDPTKFMRRRKWISLWWLFLRPCY